MDWKREYINLIGCVNPADLRIEEAQKLKMQNTPKKLYKFRKPNDNSLNNLLDDTVWLDSPAKYNDPFECVEFVDTKKLTDTSSIYSYDEYINVLLENHPVPKDILDKAKKSDNPLKIIGEYQLREYEGFDDKLIEQIIETMYQAIGEQLGKSLNDKTMKMQEHLKLCSFSECNDEVLMWSHYAESHKGFCVEYDLTKWHPVDKKWRILHPVLYQNEVYDATEHLRFQIANNTFNNLYPIISCATKALNWNYEREWRFIIQIGESFAPQNFHMGNTSAVFLGAKMEENYKEQVKTIAKSKGLEIWDSKLSSGNFKVEYDKIDYE